MKIKLLILLLLASIGATAQSWTSFGTGAIQRRIVGSDTTYRWVGSTAGTYVYGRSEAYYKSAFETVNKFVAWGNSLTEGTGSTGDSSYVSSLARLSMVEGINMGVAGNTSTQIRARFFANPQLWKYPTLFEVGRNNYLDTATVKNDISAMVTALGHNKFIVYTVLNSPWEPSGNANYDAIIAINNWIKTTYPNNYIDLREFLISQADRSSSADLLAIAGDYPPETLRYDMVHLNNQGYYLQAYRTILDINKLFININAENNFFRVQGDAYYAPTSGYGIEMFNLNNRSYIHSLSRNTGAPISLSIADIGQPQTRINENGGNLNIGAKVAVGFTPSYNTTYNLEVNGTGHFTGALTSPNLLGNNTGDETQASIVSKIGAIYGGDIDGPNLYAMTVKKFDGQFPSYYLNYANLTNKPTSSMSVNSLAKYDGAGSLVNSNISDNGTEIVLGVNTTVNGTLKTADLNVGIGASNTGVAFGTVDANNAYLQARTSTTNKILSFYGERFDFLAPVRITVPNDGNANTVVKNEDIPFENYIASGTGASTTITIPHGLTGITSTSKVIVQPLNAASAGVTFATIGSVNIVINYTIAPVLGTNNLNYSVLIKK